MKNEKKFFQGHQRLSEERRRLFTSQQEAADFFGVTRVTWGQCERGNATPGGDVLAGLAQIGADVPYILTGKRSEYGLGADERELLALFRAAPLAVKMAAIGALQGAALGGVVQTNHGDGSVMVGVQHGGKTRAGRRGE